MHMWPQRAGQKKQDLPKIAAQKEKYWDELQRMRWEERSPYEMECREQGCWKWWQEEKGDEMMEGSKGNM